jgi:RNA polymerase sigma-70 factor (ECF subfamily)
MNGSGTISVLTIEAEVSRRERLRATLRLDGSCMLVNPRNLDSLVARLADGDRKAFPDLFRELWPKVRGLCVSLLQDGSDAEDAAQQAMEKVLTRASDYDRERPALPWALAIAAWECRTVARWRERRREVLTDQLGERESTESAEEQFIREELHKAASAALGGLSEADRAALIAAYWEESRSGTSAARKRRQRALERIRVAFRRLYGPD